MWSGKKCRRAMASSFIGRGGRGARLALIPLPACAVAVDEARVHDEASNRRGEQSTGRAECGNRLAVIDLSAVTRLYVCVCLFK